MYRLKHFSVMKNYYQENIILQINRSSVNITSTQVNNTKNSLNWKKEVATKAQSMRNVGKLRKGATPTLMYYIHWDESLYLGTKHI